jgi:hypothetical protein
LLTQAINHGETWFIKEAPVLTLNYAFIEMVMTAYSELPIADYQLHNGGERGQQNAVTMSHETVVALLAFKASKNSFGKPKQTQNKLQWPAFTNSTNTVRKKKSLKTISRFFFHIVSARIAIRVMLLFGAVISNGSLTGLVDAVKTTVPVHLNPIVPINITLVCWDSSTSNPATLRILI